MVAVTVLVAVLMTETVLAASFVTYAVAPFGEMATPRGAAPTVIAVVTKLVLVLMTETVPELHAVVPPHSFAT